MVKCDLGDLGSASTESAIERLEPPEEVHGPMRPAWQGRRGPTARSRGCGGQKGEISPNYRPLPFQLLAIISARLN